MDLYTFLLHVLPDFYRLREHFFVYVVIIYLFTYMKGRNHVDRYIKILMTYWIFFGLLLIYFWRTRLPLKDILGYWGWVSPLQWSFFILGSYYLLNKKLKSPTISFTLTAFATSAGGYIYEIPYFFKEWTNGYKTFIMAFLKPNQSNIFIINSQIIAIFVVMLLLKHETNWRLHWSSLLAVTWISIFFYFVRWIPFYYVRLPTMSFFYTLWLGVEKKCG